MEITTLYDGRLQCSQHKEGYRFSVDALLLGHFFHGGKEEKVLDLCCGSGIVGLILCYRSTGEIHSITGLEVQESLAILAKKNCSLNSFASKMNVVQGDFRSVLDYFPAESFSAVVCNPPFYSPETGRPSKNKEAHIARHQVNGTLAELCRAAAVAVKNRGRVCMIYPADRLVELFSCLAASRLVPKRIQAVYSYPDQEAEARLMLVEAVKNGGASCRVLAPFYIYTEKNGPYSEPMAELYKN